MRRQLRGAGWLTDAAAEAYRNFGASMAEKVKEAEERASDDQDEAEQA